MDIYIDIVYLLNLVIHFITLLSMVVFLNMSIKTRYLFYLSLLINCSIIFIYLDTTFHILYLIWVGLSLLILFRKQYIQALVSFYIMNYIFKYTMIHFNYRSTLINGNIIVGLDFRWIYIFIISIVVIAIYTSYIFKLKHDLTISTLYYDIIITINQIDYPCKGFIDTGNVIEKDGKIILFIKKALLDEVVVKEYIEVQGVSGNQQIEIIEVDYVIVENKKYFDVYISRMNDIYIENADCLLSGKLFYWG